MDAYIVGFRSIEEAYECIDDWLIDHAKYFSNNALIQGYQELEREKTIAHFGDVEIRIMKIVID